VTPLCRASPCPLTLTPFSHNTVNIGRPYDKSGLSGEPTKGADHTDIDFGPFLDWLKDNGVMKDKVSLHDFGDEVRGVVATKKVAEGEVVIQVPEHMLMSIKRVYESPVGKVLKKHAEVIRAMRMGENAATIAVFLMHERGKPDSFWRTYIDMLPKNFTTPMFWERPLIEELQSPEFTRHVEANRAMQVMDFNLLKPLFEAHRELWPAESSGFEDFRWCSTIVITRYCELDIGGKKTVALSPMYDLPNHEPHTKTSFGWNPDTKSLVVTAGRLYQPGEQIYMSYGSKANFDLLYVYGIAFVHNPFGSIRVGVPQLPTDHRDVIEAIAKHNHVELQMNKLLRVSDLYKVPDALLQTVRVSLLRRYDLERLGIAHWNAPANLEGGIYVDHNAVALDSKPSYFVHSLEPISVYNELCVFTFLMRSLAKRYSRYATSLASDWALHSNADTWSMVPRKKRLAVTFRTFTPTPPRTVTRTVNPSPNPAGTDEKQNVLHLYRMIQTRRAKYIHDQMGSWEPPTELARGTVGTRSPRPPSFAVQRRWHS